MSVQLHDLREQSRDVQPRLHQTQPEGPRRTHESVGVNLSFEADEQNQEHLETSGIDHLERVGPVGEFQTFIQ